jgi:trigger factor
MRVTTERLEDCQVNLIIEMDAADVDKELRRTARQLSRQYNVPGYRRGKAPYHAIVRVFGREALQQQALEDIGQELYKEALEEIEYEPYEMGELQEVEWDPFRMTILLPIKPQVELGDYRAVRVPFEPESITEERVQEYLKDLQQNNAPWVPMERAAGWGDMVVIDAEGKIAEQVVLSSEGREIILEEESNIPLPGFHAQIVGMSTGEEKTFLVTYPEDDPREEVAGQEAEFAVTLHTVKEQDLPPLDDELAMMVGDYDSLDALKASIREKLETEALQKAEAEYLDKVLEAMIEAAVKIEYPPQAVDREADIALNQMERNLASSGMQFEAFLGMIGKTRETYKQELGPSAEDRLRKRLVLNQVAVQEDLLAEPEEVEVEINRLSAMLGDNADQMRQMLDTPDGRQSVAEDLVMVQVQERVMQIGKGEVPPSEGAEAEAEAEAGAGEVEEGEPPVPGPELEASEETGDSEAGEEPVGDESE